MGETVKRVCTSVVVWNNNAVQRRLLVKKAVIPESGVQQGNVLLDIGVSIA